jgi:hypothetical protein
MKYLQIDVKENELEDLIRINSEMIEPGLKYVDHQKKTDRGRLDVLFVDSGNAFVVAELKIIEDDNMLFQALDYYDFVSENIESYARIYKDFNIDPLKPIRILLVAPSFSQIMISRTKWINAAISLFIYKCIQIDEGKDIIPVFNEISLPTPREVLEEKYDLNDRINYVTDNGVKKILVDFIKTIRDIDKEHILVEPIKYSISVKILGKVVLYLSPRRNKFLIEMSDANSKWTAYPINSQEDIDDVMDIVMFNYSRTSK